MSYFPHAAPNGPAFLLTRAFFGKAKMAAPLDQNTNVLVRELRADVAPAEAPPIDGGPPSALSFEALYDQWFADVSRWVRALGAREADRDDLVQDIFLVVHRRLPDFDGQNVAGWLYQIARRKVRDHRRLLWVKQLFGTTSVPLAEGTLSTDMSPLRELETKQRRELLEELLGKLNADQSAAFTLFEIEGNSGEEIAAIQGVPINTVWARIHKARKKLQEQAERIEKRQSPRRPK
ncbi:MAG: RNA polymerase sigma factor [Myxococcales bacterium]|nr:MAG: RNA polymerase sigma factor [Myxococcales bacterium]